MIWFIHDDIKNENNQISVSKTHLILFRENEIDSFKLITNNKSTGEYMHTAFITNTY